ncbi:hypothetical protein PAPHI01_2073 [Pancytospora philotis]|nr:hypothetical protein PAPHI01_2073 [Pancytospora philotis]
MRQRLVLLRALQGVAQLWLNPLLCSGKNALNCATNCCLSPVVVPRDYSYNWLTNHVELELYRVDPVLPQNSSGVKAEQESSSEAAESSHSVFGNADDSAEAAESSDYVIRNTVERCSQISNKLVVSVCKSSAHSQCADGREPVFLAIDPSECIPGAEYIVALKHKETPASESSPVPLYSIFSCISDPCFKDSVDVDEYEPFTGNSRLSIRFKLPAGHAGCQLFKIGFGGSFWNFRTAKDTALEHLSKIKVVGADSKVLKRGGWTDEWIAPRWAVRRVSGLPNYTLPASGFCTVKHFEEVKRMIECGSRRAAVPECQMDEIRALFCSNRRSEELRALRHSCDDPLALCFNKEGRSCRRARMRSAVSRLACSQLFASYTLSLFVSVYKSSVKHTCEDLRAIREFTNPCSSLLLYAMQSTGSNQLYGREWLSMLQCHLDARSGGSFVRALHDGLTAEERAFIESAPGYGEDGAAAIERAEESGEKDDDAHKKRGPGWSLKTKIVVAVVVSVIIVAVGGLLIM